MRTQPEDGQRSRIVLITYKEVDERTGRETVLISHGFDEITGQIVIMPPETPERVGAFFDKDLGEWVIN